MLTHVPLQKSTYILRLHLIKVLAILIIHYCIMVEDNINFAYRNKHKHVQRGRSIFYQSNKASTFYIVKQIKNQGNLSPSLMS